MENNYLKNLKIKENNKNISQTVEKENKNNEKWYFDKGKGFGISTIKDGNMYIGEFKNNNKERYGMLKYINGNKYEDE